MKRRLAPAAIPALVFLVLLAGLLVHCARDLAPDRGSGGLDLVWSLPQGLPLEPSADSLRVWVRDGSGRVLVGPISAPIGETGQSVDLSLRVPAGEDRAIWMQFEAPGPHGRGTVAAGGTGGLRVLPGGLTPARVVLQPTVPSMVPISAEAGDLGYLVRWSKVPGATEYELREEGPGGTQVWIEPDTSRMVGVPLPAGFSGLLRGAERTGASSRRPAHAQAASDTTYYHVRSRPSEAAASIYGDSVGILIPGLIDLPSIIAVVPREGLADVPDTADVELVFDRAMNPASVRDTTFTLEAVDGGERVPLELEWPRGDSLVLRHDPLRWSTTYRLRVRPDVREAGALGKPLDQDPGVAGLQGFESTFTVEAYDPLQVVSVSPVDGNMIPDVNGSVRVDFNRPVRASSVTSATIHLADSLGTPVSATLRVLNGGTAVEIDPDGPLRYGWGYRLTVTSEVRDLRGAAGYPLDSDALTPYTFEPFRSGFHTEEQPLGPQVEWVVPEDGEQNAPSFRPIWVRFSEPVNASTVVARTTFKVLQRGATVGGEVFHDAESRTFRFQPTQNLRNDLVYTIEITPGVRDLDGNPLDEDREAAGYQGFTSSFRVEEEFFADRILPSFNRQDVPVDTLVSLFFGTVAVDLSTINENSLYLEHEGNKIDWTLVDRNVDTTRLVFRPTERLDYLTTYSVHIDTLLLSLRGSHFDQLPGSIGYQAFLSRFTTEPESLPPRVSTVHPGPDEQDVPVDTAVRLDFNVPVDASSITFQAVKIIRVRDGFWLPVVRVVSADGLSATFTPTAPLSTSTDYRIEVQPVLRDRYGVLFDQDSEEPGNQGFTSLFRTAQERTPPRVDPAEVHPAPDAESVPLSDSIEIGFTEPMYSLENVRDAFTLLVEGGGSVAGEGRLSDDAMRFTYIPGSALAPNTRYEVRVDTTAIDRVGNLLDQDPATTVREPYRSAFTTSGGDSSPPRVLQSDPAPNAVGISVGVYPRLEFSEPVDSVSSASVFLRDAHGVPVPLGQLVISQDRRSVSLHPAAPLLYDSDYTLFATPALRDTAGNAFDQRPDSLGNQSYRAPFHTQVQSTAPRVVDSNPVDEETRVNPEIVPELIFSEPIDTLTAVFPNLALYRTGIAETVQCEITWLADRMHFFLHPHAPLVPGGAYRLVATSGLRDLQGTPLDQHTSEGANFDISFHVGIPPAAHAGAGICDPAGLTVTVDGGATTDADGALVRAIWEWGDGKRDFVTIPGPHWPFMVHDYDFSDSSGCNGADDDGDGLRDETGSQGCDESYHIRLTVVDDDSLVSSDVTGVSFCAFVVLPDSVRPRNGAAGVDTLLSEVRIRFTRPIDPDDLADSLFALERLDSHGDPVLPADSVTVALDLSDSLTVVLSLADTLAPNTDYRVSVLPPLRSADGRSFDQDLRTPNVPTPQPFTSEFHTQSRLLRGTLGAQTTSTRRARVPLPHPLPVTQGDRSRGR